MRIVLAQINPVVGDVEGNVRRILEAAAQADDADLVVFPELCVSGYPPEDLILRPAYVAACARAVARLASEGAGGPTMVVGSPWPGGTRDPKPLNATILLAGGEIVHVAGKRHLPDYGVFDEDRTFRPGPAPQVTRLGDVALGLMTCEDMWYPDVAGELARAGADILIVPHGSPYRQTASAERTFQAEARARETGLPVIFVNQVGGQDELVFDGGAFVATPGGVAARAPLFENGLFPTVWERAERGLDVVSGPRAQWPGREARDYHALVVGTRDYVAKSGFSEVVIGLSGGIDSAMVAAIAADAVGPDNVHCVMLPSRYTSDHSLEDAKACAAALGVRYDIVPVAPAIAGFEEMTAPLFEGRAPDVTEENLQSRIRGTFLMALSNKFGGLLLSTGNKSEMAVGYATLYGDMNGAYNPLKDVYKTDVFALARWRNGAGPVGRGPGGEVIPERIITKPPSAELRDDQRDDDSLPPYDVLDAILRGLVEEEASVEAIAARGHDVDLVERIQHLLYLAEYKRRQSPPGPKITTRNFGRDRRYPIVNRWRERS